MSGPIEVLAEWFNGLPEPQQEEVVKFLYEEKAEVAIQQLREGINCGLVPSSSVGLCPTCGNAW